MGLGDVWKAALEKVKHDYVAPGDQPYHPYARFSAFKARFGGTLVRPIGAQDIYFYPQLAKTLVSRLAEPKGVVS